jgi:hypothetical protein
MLENINFLPKFFIRKGTNYVLSILQRLFKKIKITSLILYNT